MESKDKQATITEIDRIADGYQECNSLKKERNSVKKKTNILKSFKPSKDAKTTTNKNVNDSRRRKISKKVSKSTSNAGETDGCKTTEMKAVYEKLSMAFEEYIASKKSETSEKNEDNQINVYKKMFADVCDNQTQRKEGDIEKDNKSLIDKPLSHHQYTLLGSVQLNVKGIKFSGQQKQTSNYEASLQYGNQKWRVQGTVTSTNEATFNENEIILHPLSNHTLAIKVSEVKILRRVTLAEQVSYDITDFIHFKPKEIAIKLNDKGSVTLILTTAWIPLEMNKLSYLLSSCSNKETKSIDQTDSHQSTIRQNKEDFTTPTNSPGGDVDPLLIGHGKEEEAFYARMSEYAAVAALMKAEHSEKDVEQEIQCKEEAEAILEELIPLLEMVNEVLDDYRGRYAELQLLEETVYRIQDHLQNVCKNYDAFRHCNENYHNFGQQWIQKKDISDFDYNGIAMVDEAIIPHLKIVLRRIKDVGKFGPLKVGELYALDCIEKQGNALKRLMDMQGNKNIKLEDIPELAKRRTLLELWRSSCDGSTLLCLNAKILCLELQSEFGRDVRRQHPDVAEQLFPELVRRILGQDDIVNLEERYVTVFQFVQFLEEMEANEEIGDLAKVVDKLALEMFLTTMLQSENRDLVLAAVTRVGSLLALRTSNLCALTHLVLSKDENVREAAVKHIIEIASDAALHDKAFISLVELLESRSKRDRQCSCCALGLLGAKECIPQLAYLCHSDEQFDVRQAAGHALLAFGEEGELALEHATCTLLTQTMTHKVSLKGNIRMGTAL